MDFLLKKVEKAVNEGDDLVRIREMSSWDDEDITEYVEKLFDDYGGNRETKVLKIGRRIWRVFAYDDGSGPWLALYRIGVHPCDPKYIQKNGYCPQCNKLHAAGKGKGKTQAPASSSASRKSLADIKKWWLEHNADNIANFKPSSPTKGTEIWTSVYEDRDHEDKS